MTGLVTDNGIGDVVAALITANTIKHIGWGAGAGQVVGATDLASPLPEDRTAGALAAVTTDTTGDTLRVTGTVTATAARTVSEVGVFSAPSGAELDIYGDFPAVTLNSGDSIAYTIDVVVDQA